MTCTVPTELPGAITEPGSNASEPTTPLPENMPALVKAPLTTALLVKRPLLITSPIMLPALLAVPTLTSGMFVSISVPALARLALPATA